MNNSADTYTWCDGAETQVVSPDWTAFRAHRGVILVTDRSSSVHKVMDAINKGMTELSGYIAGDPASSAVDIALVSFGTDVTVHNLRNGGTVDSSDFEGNVDDAFVPAKDFPRDLKLEAHGLTSLNDALVTACELERAYAHHIVKKTRKPPLKSLVILLTDGKDEPGGDVSEAARCVGKLVEEERIHFLPFGYGNYSEDQFAELCRANGTWFKIADASGDAITQAYKLIGASVRTMSHVGADDTERLCFENNVRASSHIEACSLEEFLNNSNL